MVVSRPRFFFSVSKALGSTLVMVIKFVHSLLSRVPPVLSESAVPEVSPSHDVPKDCAFSSGTLHILFSSTYIHQYLPVSSAAEEIGNAREVIFTWCLKNRIGSDLGLAALFACSLATPATAASSVSTLL